MTLTSDIIALRPGQSIVYYDTRDHSGMSLAQNHGVRELWLSNKGEPFAKLYADGYMELLQRHGDGFTEYIAVRKRK